MVIYFYYIIYTAYLYCTLNYIKSDLYFFSPINSVKLLIAKGSTKMKTLSKSENSVASPENIKLHYIFKNEKKKIKTYFLQFFHTMKIMLVSFY